MMKQKMLKENRESKYQRTLSAEEEQISKVLGKNTEEIKLKLSIEEATVPKNFLKIKIIKIFHFTNYCRSNWRRDYK